MEGWLRHSDNHPYKLRIRSVFSFTADFSRMDVRYGLLLWHTLYLHVNNDASLYSLGVCWWQCNFGCYDHAIREPRILLFLSCIETGRWIVSKHHKTCSRSGASGGRRRGKEDSAGALSLKETQVGTNNVTFALLRRQSCLENNKRQYLLASWFFTVEADIIRQSLVIFVIGMVCDFSLS